MTMRELRYRDITAADCADLLRLYCHSFPADERRVYDGVKGFRSFLNANSDKFHPLVITLDGRFAGFLTYWEFPGYVYVEHFAVEPEMRGNDIGGSTLRHLVENISDRVLLEVEHPDTPEARRRISFYERHGFRLHADIEYMQPPYDPSLPEVPLLLMTHGDVDLTDPHTVLAPMLRAVYNA